MKSHTSLVAQQIRLSEWADLVRDCLLFSKLNTASSVTLKQVFYSA